MEKNYKLGLIAVLTSSFLWGILPIYWKSLVPIPSYVIILYRIFCVGVVSFVISLKLYGWERVKEPLGDKKKIIKFFVAGVIITGNWSIYIWAVNAGYIIQTSIGYYMQPLIVCMFGVILFKEKVTKYNLSAFGLGILGIVIVIIHFGEIPTVAIGLALTFAIYAALKKSLKTEAILSLVYETVFLAPIALGLIIYLEVNGRGAIGVGEPYQYLLLLLTGIATAVPLGLFAVGANNLPLVTLGVAQYVSPTMALLLGVFFYEEPFDRIQFISFAIIWTGLIVFTVGERKRERRSESDSKA